MSVRFDAAADRLVRTSDLLDYNAAYTVMGWVYLSVDQNAHSAIFVLDSNSTDNHDYLGTATDGTELFISTSVAGTYWDNYVGNDPDDPGSQLSTGTWYHVALVRTDATHIRAYLDGALDINISSPDTSGRTAATRLEIGGDTSGNNFPLNGRAAYVKAWSVALTQAEIQQEMRTIRPIRYANLHGWWPCFPGATERLRDYSGNGRNWTEIGTLTDEDGPGISWGGRSPLSVVYTDAGITLTPSPVAIPLAIAAPTLSHALSLTPSALAIPTVIPAPTMELAYGLGPDPVALPTVIPAPSVDLSYELAPDPVAVPIALPDALLTLAYGLSPDPVQMPLVIQDPTLSLSLGLAPDSVVIAIALPDVTIDNGQLILTPSPVTIPLSLPDVSMDMGGISVTPGPVEVTLNLPDAVLSLAYGVSPDPVVLLLGIPAPGLSHALALSPDPVEIQLVIVAVTISTGGAQMLFRTIGRGVMSGVGRGIG